MIELTNPPDRYCYRLVRYGNQQEIRQRLGSKHTGGQFQVFDQYDGDADGHPCHEVSIVVHGETSAWDDFDHWLGSWETGAIASPAEAVDAYNQVRSTRLRLAYWSAPA